MISYKEFEEIVVNILKRDINSNKQQKEAILSPVDESLFIVAGPGSGKTTVMVLKILKYIFVDDIKPNEIISTTFTRKAADEIYSRILSWGDEIKKYILDNIDCDDFDEISEILVKIDKIDFNRILVGTIDSVAEELIKIHKDPGTNLPIVIEKFISKSAMINAGLLKNNRYLNLDLQEYLKNFTSRDKLDNPEKMSDILLEMKDRLYFDQVDYYSFYDKVKDGKGAKEALDAIADYKVELESRNIIDFAMLESNFLNNLKNGKLDDFLDDVKIILVDEYQDTNLIQEDIYFTIAEAAIGNGGNITVVGDDDQSLYRFRGATVDLFTNFKRRVKDALGICVKEINLSTNYRSSENIINHCNRFVELDMEYQKARVDSKPRIIAPDFKDDEMPILGMFRNNPEMLSRDLALLLGRLINRGEVELKVHNVIKNSFTDQRTLYEAKKNNKVDKIKLVLDDENGSASDVAVLTYSPKEINHGTYMFPYFLRKELLKVKPPIHVFNPRGRDLQDVEEVAIFCGLILECIDPESKIQDSEKNFSSLAKRNMKKWRLEARNFIKMNPEPHYPMTLGRFVKAWQTRTPINIEDNKWPDNANLMDLAYKLITWIEDLHEDVEGIVYLKAITQTITQTGFFNNFKGQILFNDSERNSILEAMWNIFIPIATGSVEIDEALLETLPDDRVSIMSIHQSKGLEFPMVVVDVGSKFKKNDSRHQQLRFPKLAPKYDSLEDLIRSNSSLGKIERNENDRAFDDLTRLYFVAFSRAESVLLLIGLNQCIYGYKSKNKDIKIPNIALGWNRNEKLVGFDEIYMI